MARRDDSPAGCAESEVRTLLRRARIAARARGMAAGSVAAAVALGCTLLSARLLGSAARLPSWSWLAVLAAGALLGAAWRSRRLRFDAAHARACLDRRLGLGGLLMAAGDTALEPGWQQELDARLAAAPRRARPRFELRSALLRLGGAGAFVGAVALLPPPEPSGDALVRSVGRALTAAVDETVAEVDLALEQGRVAESQGEELRGRAAGLRERLLAGDPVAWSDVDALRDELRADEQAHRAGLQAVRSGFDSLRDQARREGGLDQGGRAQAARLAERARDLGLFEDLPPDLRRAAEQALDQGAAEQARRGERQRPGDARGGAGRAAGAGTDLDAEQLERLAAAMSQSAGRRLRRGAGDDRPLQPDEVPDLRDLLDAEGLLGGSGGEKRRDAVGGPGFDPTPAEGEADGRPGRGGITRGRGDANLHYADEIEVDTAGLRAEKLAPGQAVPDRWQVVGSTRGRPLADPERSAATAGSSAAAAGRGAATFRRSLAPRHRAAVRRFFSDDPGGRDR